MQQDNDNNEPQRHEQYVDWLHFGADSLAVFVAAEALHSFHFLFVVLGAMAFFFLSSRKKKAEGSLVRRAQMNPHKGKSCSVFVRL